MSELYFQLTKGSIRIGDQDRERAAASLGDHFASGRLEREEYDERLEAIFAARTWGDLSPVFRDLPSPGPAAMASPKAAPRPVARPRPRSRIPILPVLLILLGVAAFTGAWFVFFIGLGLLLWARSHARSQARGHASGSCGRARGSWS